jgi:ankyrin repeat protein
VKLLLERGVDPNTQDKDGDTPLHKAAYKGYVDVVKLLLEHGADPNIKNKSGITPLYWAVFRGHVEVVKLLLEHGAFAVKTPEDNHDGYVNILREGSAYAAWLSVYGSKEQRRLAAEFV